MGSPQIILTPSGEELVVLPRADYEALLDHAAEDADDVAIYDAVKAELAAGGSCRDTARGQSAEGHSPVARRDASAFDFHDGYRPGLSVGPRKRAPYGNT